MTTFSLITRRVHTCQEGYKMLIRIKGGTRGIKEYLETGQKKDRDFNRQELDERLILDGNLNVTNKLINSINKSENYMHITLAFKEDFISKDVLKNITKEFKEFVSSAYQNDEFNFYAEAHLPRLKSYVDKNANTVERKPHIHIVIPKLNLISGNLLRPFGFEKNNLHFINAFQEFINTKYNLQSPKLNRKIFNNNHEIISRLKADIFEGANKDKRERILKDIIDNNISNYDDFKGYLKTIGELKVRNENKPTEYLNIKFDDMPKGINLKDYVFSKEFLNLSYDKKIEFLNIDKNNEYLEQSQSSNEVQNEHLELLKEWHNMRAKEVKYLDWTDLKNKGYKDLSYEDKLTYLESKEQKFYNKYSYKLAVEPIQNSINQKELSNGRESSEYDTQRNIYANLSKSADNIKTAKSNNRVISSRARRKRWQFIRAIATSIEAISGENRQNRQENQLINTFQNKLFKDFYSTELPISLKHFYIKQYNQNKDEPLTVIGNKKKDIKIIDKGSRIIAKGSNLQDQAKLMLEIAFAKGWDLEKIKISGSDEFKSIAQKLIDEKIKEQFLNSIKSLEEVANEPLVETFKRDNYSSSYVKELVKQSNQEEVKNENKELIEQLNKLDVSLVYEYAKNKLNLLDPKYQIDLDNNLIKCGSRSLTIIEFFAQELNQIINQKLLNDLNLFTDVTIR